MPAINLRKAFYDELVRQGDDPVAAANEAVEEYIRDRYDVEVDA